jgi:hypothetical protein
MLDQVDAVARHLQAPEMSGSVRPLSDGPPGLELLEGSGEEQLDLPGAAEG